MEQLANYLCTAAWRIFSPLPEKGWYCTVLYIVCTVHCVYCRYCTLYFCWASSFSVLPYFTCWERLVPYCTFYVLYLTLYVQYCTLHVLYCNLYVLCMSFLIFCSPTLFYQLKKAGPVMYIVCTVLYIVCTVLYITCIVLYIVCTVDELPHLLFSYLIFPSEKGWYCTVDELPHILFSYLKFSTAKGWYCTVLCTGDDLINFLFYYPYVFSLLYNTLYWGRPSSFHVLLP